MTDATNHIAIDADTSHEQAAANAVNQSEAAASTTAGITAEEATNAEVKEISVAMIRVDSSFNPRKHFEDADIAAFAQRIRESGWLSPPLVRPDPYGEGYLLVAGERRFRAINLLGWTTVQVTIKVMTDAEHRIQAMRENADRRDLTVAEEAMYARDYLDAYEGDYDKAAESLGWNVTRLRHRLKLLRCSNPVLDALMRSQITLGHAELLSSIPVENQDKALPRIIERSVSVAALREQINGFAIPLASAIFDTADCANCPFNTSCQGTLFEARVSDGNCTGKECYQEKTTAALEAKRTKLREDFGTVVLISEKAPEQSIPLVKHGEAGVGPAQFDACRTCEFRGAAIHDALGASLGRVDEPLCFNRSCHAVHVESYKVELTASNANATDPAESQTATASGTTTAKTGGKQQTKKPPTKAKPKAQATLKAVAEQYGSILGRAGAAAISNSRITGLALALYGLRQLQKSEANVDMTKLWSSLGLPDVSASNDTAALVTLSSLDEATLLDAIDKVALAILTTDVNNAPFQHRLKRRAFLATTVEKHAVSVADHVSVDSDFLASHTKPALETVLEESGFKAFKVGEENGEKLYRTLVGQKKDDLVTSVLSSEFKFTGYVPGGFAAQVQSWRKEANL